MFDNLLHQPSCRAGAAQRWIGFDMGKLVLAVMDTVIRPNQQAVLFPLEAVLLLIVDHFLAGSRYIQGNESPIGTIHNVPARA